MKPEDMVLCLHRLTLYYICYSRHFLRACPANRILGDSPRDAIRAQWLLTDGNPARPSR